MTKNYMSGMLDSMLAAMIAKKKMMEEKMQKAGRRIRRNIEKGQADLKSGKINSSAYINPFKK